MPVLSKEGIGERKVSGGDAAGQVFSGIGEGIYFSLKAGQLAGQTARKAIKDDKFDRKFLKEYEHLWKKSFGRQIDAGIVLATTGRWQNRPCTAVQSHRRLPKLTIDTQYLNGMDHCANPGCAGGDNHEYQKGKTHLFFTDGNHPNSARRYCQLVE